VLGAILALPAGKASAVDACPTPVAGEAVVITESCRLLEDVEFLEDGYVIEADDVTLDLNGHTLTGNGGVSHSGVEVNGFNRVTIKNGTIREFQHGVELGDSSGSLVTRNTIKDNGMMVLDDNNTPGDPSDDELVPNGTGVDLFEAHGNVIEQNTIKDTIGRGIDVENASTANYIKRNTIMGSADRGIDVREGSSANVIRENSITGSGDRGIDMRGAARANVIEGNTIKQNGIRGINVRDGSSANVIDGNDVEDNAGIGILLSTADHNEVVNNVVTGNSNDGMSVSDSDGNSVHGNKLNDNGDNGLDLDEDSANNVVRENKMNDNAGTGIRVRTEFGPPLANLFLGNEALDNDEFDIFDDTAGTGTENTANYYIENECETGSPGGLCEEDGGNNGDEDED
jgi:parallel beta-helix repeat protein